MSSQKNKFTITPFEASAKANDRMINECWIDSAGINNCSFAAQSLLLRLILVADDVGLIAGGPAELVQHRLQVLL